jgi:MFS family permease
MTIQPQYRLYACFFLFSTITGAMYSRLPEIQSTLGVNEAQLGLTLIGAAIGSLISLTFSAPLIERLGARRTGFITVIGATACYTAVAFVTGAPAAFAALFFAGLLAGALEINLNVQLGRLEAHLGRSLMSRGHGFWSLGFFVTSLVAAPIRQAAIPASWHLGGLFVIVALVAIVFISGMRDAPVAADAVDDKPPLIAFPTLPLLPLCLIGIAAFLVEGAGVDWSAIYMRDTFQVEPFLGTLGLMLFTFLMSLMRLYAGPLVDRSSPRLVVTILLGVSIVGLVAVWLAPHPYVAIAGFALLGAGCSAVYPLVVSVAAQRTDRPASVNVAAIGQVSFIIFFLAPPTLGFIAHNFGIRQSYLLCLVLVVLSLFAVRALPAREKALPLGTVMPEPMTPNG